MPFASDHIPGLQNLLVFIPNYKPVFDLGLGHLVVGLQLLQHLVVALLVFEDDVDTLVEVCAVQLLHLEGLPAVELYYYKTWQQIFGAFI